MELVDTHCHIQSIGQSRGESVTRQMWANSKLTADGVVSQAKRAGVSRLMCVGCDLADSQLVVEFVKNRPGCWASIGIHPHEAQHYVDNPAGLERLAALVDEPKVVAIGECGFDLYYNHSSKSDQSQVLKFQIELALNRDLPIIFHVREAFDEFWEVFDTYSGIRGVLHSYTDSANNLKKALDRGLYIGVNGIATFANKAQRQVYKAIPLTKLLLETDAPFLTPVPYRGSINAPDKLGGVADFLADLRSESPGDLAAATTANAIKLFALK